MYKDKETTNSGRSVPKIKITKVVNMDNVVESIVQTNVHGK